MAKLLKMISGAVIVLILLVIIACFIISKTLNPNDYKSHIQDYVYQESGHKLDIAGTLHFSYFPWLGLTASKVSSLPEVYIENLGFKVRVLPLLIGKIEIGTIMIDGAKVYWTVNAEKSQQKSWAPYQKSSSKQRRLAMRTLDIQHFEITNSEVHIKNNTIKKRWDFDNITLDADTYVDFSEKTLSIPHVLLKATVQRRYLPALPISVEGDFRFSARDRSMTLSPVHTQLGDITIHQNIHIDQLFTEPHFIVDTTVHNAQIGTLCKMLFNKNTIDGTMDFNGQMTTHGHNREELITNAVGNGQITVNKGKVRGIDLSYLITTGLAFIHQKPLPPAATTPLITDFSTLRASYQLNNGMIINNDLELITDNNIRTTGKGYAYLAHEGRETMDYELAIHALNVTIPVNVRGSLANPIIKVNLQSLAERYIGNGVKKFLDKNKKGLNKTLQSLLQ